MVPEKGSTIKNADIITNFSFQWKEIKINCSSYIRKRELKRYAQDTCGVDLLGQMSKLQRVEASQWGEVLVGSIEPDSPEVQQPCWQKCILQGMAAP